MSGTERPDLDRLAELDAGLLDEATAAGVRAAAAADPRSRAELDALAATRAELAAHPTPPVPPGATERWAAALRLAAAAQGEASGAATPEPGPPAERTGPDQASGPRTTPAASTGPHDPSPPAGERPRPTDRHADRRRWARVPRPALAAAAVLVVVGVVGLLQARGETPPSVSRLELGSAGLAALGVGDTGPLSDPARRSACLNAVAAPGLDAGAALLGGRRVRFDGSPGVLLVLSQGERGVFRIVVVDEGCGAGGGTLLADTTVGG